MNDAPPPTPDVDPEGTLRTGLRLYQARCEALHAERERLVQELAVRDAIIAQLRTEIFRWEARAAR